MEFTLELPGILTTRLPSQGGEDIIHVTLALERPTVLIKASSLGQGEASVTMTCNCPDGERQAREAAQSLAHLVKLRLEFRTTAPRSPFSCRVCRPALALVAYSISRGEPRPLEEVEVLLELEDAIILHSMLMGGISTHYLIPGVSEPPAGPWLMGHVIPPPGLRIVVARLPEWEGSRRLVGGERVVALLGLVARMLWEKEYSGLARVLARLSEIMGGEAGVPLLPVEENGGEWYWSPLPSPEECSRELLEYRERLSKFLDEHAVERVVTRLSPGGVLEVG